VSQFVDEAEALAVAVGGDANVHAVPLAETIAVVKFVLDLTH
jgi:hypothetical protein